MAFDACRPAFGNGMAYYKKYWRLNNEYLSSEFFKIIYHSSYFYFCNVIDAKNFSNLEKYFIQL